MPNTTMEGPPTLAEMFPPDNEDKDVITCWLHRGDSKVTVAFEELKPGDVATFNTKDGRVETRKVQGVPYRIHLDKGTWTWAVQVGLETEE